MTTETSQAASSNAEGETFCLQATCPGKSLDEMKDSIMAREAASDPDNARTGQTEICRICEKGSTGPIRERKFNRHAQIKTPKRTCSATSCVANETQTRHEDSTSQEAQTALER